MMTVHTLNKTPKVEDRFRKDMEGNQLGCDCSDSGKRCQWPEQGSGKGIEKNIYKAHASRAPQPTECKGAFSFYLTGERRWWHQEEELIQKEGDKIVFVYIESEVLREHPGRGDQQVERYTQPKLEGEPRLAVFLWETATDRYD